MRGGRDDRREEIADLIRLGMNEAAARAVFDEEDKGKPFGLWLSNIEAYNLFVRTWRRWRFSPMTGQRICMDLQQVESAIRLLRIPARRWPELLALMERCEAVALNPEG